MKINKKLNRNLIRFIKEQFDSIYTRRIINKEVI